MKKILFVIFISVIISAFLIPSAAAVTLPSWYPSDTSNFSDFHGTNLPRVVDDADIFTDMEEARLTEKVNALIAEFGNKYDLVIFTDVCNYGIGRGMEASDGVYPADFYQFNGYGKGDNYSGSVIFICMEPGNRYWWSAARGDSRPYFSYDNVNALDDGIESYMVDGDYYGAMVKYITLLEEIYSTGRIAKKRTVGDYAGAVIAALVVGLIAGLSNMSSKVKNMKKVAYAKYANDYIVQNSFVLRNINEMFLYKNVTRTYIEPSSRSGGGGSSYSGGYSSSGGGSFSGGGRHF